ncbi:MAG: hypothetical protein ACI4EH_08285 [Oliverpabstia sp.]
MDRSFSNNAISTLSNGLIESVERDRNTTFITVSYSNCFPCERNNASIRLVIGKDTLILDESGRRIPASQLTQGMLINAAFSSAMTRSIPPQSNAFVIQITDRPPVNQTVVGRIVNIDRRNRSFTTISDGNLSSTILFNVPENAKIFDFSGRPMSFNRLVPGMRVRVIHANFMTASIPPQTTALEIRVIR